MAVASDKVELTSAVWGPVEIAADDIGLLSDFSGLSTDECIHRLEAYRLEDVAAEWHQANPQTQKEVHAFYANTQHYLWELLLWHASADYERYFRRLEDLGRAWDPQSNPTVLDYGAGVGTAGLRLAALGYRVTIADIPGPTLDFAKARLERRGVSFEAIEVTTQVPDLRKSGWHVLVCFDVLEHVPEPAAVAEALVGALVPGGGAAIVAGFDAQGETHPHHLESGAARFRGHRWHFYLQGLGMERTGDRVYRKLYRPSRVARRLQYLLWRKTGIRVERVQR